MYLEWWHGLIHCSLSIFVFLETLLPPPVYKPLPIFYILLTVHLGSILVNNQPGVLLFLNVFISILYMFRATQCSSSGVSIVSIHHLVYIILCRRLSGMPDRQAFETVTYTEWYIPDDVLIQLILLMISTGLLETCREVK